MNGSSSSSTTKQQQYCSFDDEREARADGGATLAVVATAWKQWRSSRSSWQYWLARPELSWRRKAAQPRLASIELWANRMLMVHAQHTQNSTQQMRQRAKKQRRRSGDRNHWRASRPTRRRSSNKLSCCSQPQEQCSDFMSGRDLSDDMSPDWQDICF